jgi:hypothetical protein
MRPTVQTFLLCAAAAIAASPLRAQAPATLQPPAANDPVQMLASRLDLTRYKATIKGLTQFGDRRQGTDRNANAVTWIETQLKSYGCANVERITYDYQPAAAAGAAALDSAGRAAAASARAQAAAFGSAQGGGRMRGMRTRTGVNVDSLAQKDLALRALNMQPTKPGMRQEVVCTKVGSTHPEEMYIIGAHMDGHGWGEAANDDGSGTALVMEIARIMSMPDVKTDRSIRFALWNNEETGLNGARAYVVQREALQGKESPVGSGKYPEPKWLGMIQHDMMMFDHGMPRPDGTMSPEQRPEADHGVAEARVVLSCGEREVRHGLSRGCGAAHDEHGQRAVPGHHCGDQPARERARARGWRWVGSAVAPGHRRLLDVHRQGLSSWVERGANNTRRDRTARRRYNRSLIREPEPGIRDQLLRPRLQDTREQGGVCSSAARRVQHPLGCLYSGAEA